jgi:hypothetical protein
LEIIEKGANTMKKEYDLKTVLGRAGYDIKIRRDAWLKDLFILKRGNGMIYFCNEERQLVIGHGLSIDDIYADDYYIIEGETDA